MVRLRLFLLLGLCGACNALLGNEEGTLVASGGFAGTTAGNGSGAMMTAGGSSSGGGAGTSANGGSTAGNGGTGGSASGSGGSTAGSSTCEVPVCNPDPPPESCQQVHAALGHSPLIDNMEDGDAILRANDNRNGGWWAGDDQTGTTTPSTDPDKKLPATLAPSRNGSTVGFHFSGADHTGWGGVLGLDLQWAACYDARKYAGIRFWAKSEGGTASTNVQVQTFADLPCDNGGSCTQCYCQPNQKTISLEANWKEYVLPWSDFVGGFVPFNAAAFRGVRWSNAGPAWDVWIDDVSFIPAIDPSNDEVCAPDACIDTVANGVACCLDQACGVDTGTGCEAGSGSAPEILYDFESDVQGWQESGDTGITLESDTTRSVTGTHSLKVTVPALAVGNERLVMVSGPPLWPETAVTLHVWTPPGTDGLTVQAMTGVNNYLVYTSGPDVTLNRGGWTPLRLTVPPATTTFPGGIQQLVVKFAVYAGTAFAGGDFYIDAIAVTGGVAQCGGADAGNQTFEAGSGAWQVESSPADTVIEASTDRSYGGSQSLKVTFTGLPTGVRRISLPIGPAGAKAYCGDTVTARVWTPTGSAALLFQVFANHDNYDTFSGTSPATYTRNGWTTNSHTLPSTVGPGGVQRIGIEFNNTGAAFNGSVYIDDVTW